MRRRARVSAVHALQAAAAGAFAFLSLVTAYHHLSSEGWKSGLAELFLAPLALVAVYILSTGAGDRHRAAKRVLLLVLPAVAAFLLLLALYHCTHRGVPSAVVESIMALLLLASLALSLGSGSRGRREEAGSGREAPRANH